MGLSLSAIIAEVLRIEPTGLDDDAGMNVTENWDSLNQFMILTAVEQAFNARLTIEEMEAASTMLAIRDLLRNQGITFDD
jgi:acyl carrier protein